MAVVIRTFFYQKNISELNDKREYGLIVADDVKNEQFYLWCCFIDDQFALALCVSRKGADAQLSNTLLGQHASDVLLCIVGCRAA